MKITVYMFLRELELKRPHDNYLHYLELFQTQNQASVSGIIWPESEMLWGGQGVHFWLAVIFQSSWRKKETKRIRIQRALRLSSESITTWLQHKKLLHYKTTITVLHNWRSLFTALSWQTDMLDKMLNNTRGRIIYSAPNYRVGWSRIPMRIWKGSILLT